MVWVIASTGYYTGSCSALIDFTASFRHGFWQSGTKGPIRVRVAAGGRGPAEVAIVGHGRGVLWVQRLLTGATEAAVLVATSAGEHEHSNQRLRETKAK